MFLNESEGDNVMDSNYGTESDALLPQSSHRKRSVTYGILGDVGSVSKESSKAEEAKEAEAEVRRLVPYAPDGGYGWVIVAVAFLSNFVLDGVSLCPGVLQNAIQVASGIRNSSSVTRHWYQGDHVEYNISVGMYTLIGSILLSMQFLLGPIVALLITKIGLRGVGMMGPVIASLGIFLSWACCPVVPNIWILIIFYGLVTGFGFGMMYQTSMVMISAYFSKKRSLAIGIAICGTGVGSIVFPTLINYMIELQGWQGAFLLQAGIVLFSTTFAIFYRPLPMKLETTNAGEMEDYPSGSNENRVTLAVATPMGVLLKSPTFVILAISSAIAALGLFGPFAFVPGMSVTGFHMSMKSSVLAVTCIGISNTLGRLFCGYIADRPWVNQLTLNNIAMTVAGVATIVVPFMTDEYQMYIYVIIFGFSIGIFAVLRSVLVITFLGLHNFNNAFGMVLMCMGITTLAGNPICGWLKDNTGNYDWSFYVAGSYFVVGAILCYPLQCIANWENRYMNAKYSSDIA